jgi:hypothetical protein
MGSG